MRQIPLAIGPQPAPDFDGFVVGGNAAALAHLRALETPARAGLPVGAGRQRQDPSAAVASRARPLAGRRGSPGSSRRRRCRGALADHRGLTILDHCESLDDVLQQAAFALFVDATARGTMVLAAGSRAAGRPSAARRFCAAGSAGAMCSRCSRWAEAEYPFAGLGRRGARGRGLELADGVAGLHPSKRDYRATGSP